MIACSNVSATTRIAIDRCSNRLMESLARAGVTLQSARRGLTEQLRGYVRDQVVNVETGGDALIVAVELKRRRAVHEGPQPDGDLLCVGGVAVLATVGRHLLDDALQAAFAAFVDVLDLPDFGFVPEHESKDRRPGDGKIEIGESHSGDARHRAGSALGNGFCVDGRELLGAARHDLLEDLLLIAEMIVRRGGREASAAAGVSQSEAVGTV